MRGDWLEDVLEEGSPCGYAGTVSSIPSMHEVGQGAGEEAVEARRLRTKIIMSRIEGSRKATHWKLPAVPG